MSEKLLTFIRHYNQDSFSQMEKELLFFTCTLDIDNFLIFWYDRAWGFFSPLRQDDWQMEIRISHKEKPCIFTQLRLEESNNCPNTWAQPCRMAHYLLQESLIAAQSARHVFPSQDVSWNQCKQALTPLPTCCAAVGWWSQPGILNHGGSDQQRFTNTSVMVSPSHSQR